MAQTARKTPAAAVRVCAHVLACVEVQGGAQPVNGTAAAARVDKDQLADPPRVRRPHTCHLASLSTDDVTVMTVTALQMERRERLRKLLAEREAAGDETLEGASLIGQVRSQQTLQEQPHSSSVVGLEACMKARCAALCLQQSGLGRCMFCCPPR